eukprot:CAMPEP_0175820244 /NCGR_PEP_ID=MMETSP0107_2-20121207/8499_1 /TAXON_ID=195067 ORGANISM="Goniomonas pacifica, Strain CCMP1869" /NCGR_SAMPLE_ID=MMETSP0107_2 /ASSEMBLY_ACC=CAM_ASM_000203 /LENGTH=119 /DNA_ID=CAMNT_0017132545 /DNA_START=374 /DNA_END=730 /DNA_ORIENTATION=+
MALMQANPNTFLGLRIEANTSCTGPWSPFLHLDQPHSAIELRMAQIPHQTAGAPCHWPRANACWAAVKPGGRKKRRQRRPMWIGMKKLKLSRPSALWNARSMTVPNERMTADCHTKIAW